MFHLNPAWEIRRILDNDPKASLAAPPLVRLVGRPLAPLPPTQQTNRKQNYKTHLSLIRLVQY